MEKLILGERESRVGLVVLALPQLAIGVWALVSPHGWFDNFPGGGKHWLPLYGGFDEHLVIDVGSAFLALGVLLVAAAVWFDRRLAIVASVAYLVYQLPHAIYHFGADDVLSSGDQVANTVGLALALFLALGILVAALRPVNRAVVGGSSPTAGTGRSSSSPS
jgi:hypothetical protein